MLNEFRKILRRLAIFASVVVLLSGCGSDTGSDTNNVLIRPRDPAPESSTTMRVRGRLRLDVPIAGATVTVIDSDNTEVPLSSPSTTDSGGFFTVEVPDDRAFTVTAVVNLQGVDEVYGRSYDRLPNSPYLHINALTTLAARYRQLHPSLSARAAETLVKQALDIPQSLDAGMGVHAHAVSNFAHSAFLREARAYPGGAIAYIDSLAAGIDAVPGRVQPRAAGAAAFLSQGSPGGGSGQGDDLSTASSAVSEALAALEKEESEGDVTSDALNHFALSVSTFTDTSSVVADDTAKSLGHITKAAEGAGAAAAEKVATSVVSTGLKDLVKTIASDVLFSVIGSVESAVFSAIFPTGPNPEVIAALTAIETQLKTLQDSVDQLSAFIQSAFQKSEFETAVLALSPQRVTIDTAWQGPDGNSGGYAGALRKAALKDYRGSVLGLQQILPGGNDYFSITELSTAQGGIADAQLGIDGPPALMEMFRDLVSRSANGGGKYRYASNYSINQMHGQWSQLAGYQVKASQVIACLYRADTIDGPDFTLAQATIKATSDQIQEQRSQLPFPLPDDKFIFDTTSGLVLYGEIFAPVAIGDNLNFTPRMGNWPSMAGPDLNFVVNPDVFFPWSNAQPLVFGAGDLEDGTWVLPTPGMLWTFLDPDGSTTYSGGYTHQPSSPDIPYLAVLQQHGFTIDSPSPWTFETAGLVFNHETVGQYILNNEQFIDSGPFSLPYTSVITTGYNSPWNSFSLTDGSVFSGFDRGTTGSQSGEPTDYGAIFSGFEEIVWLLTAENTTVAPYVLMAWASPSDAPLHPDSVLFSDVLPLSSLANVPVSTLGGGLHCSTNRAFFGCGRQQGAGVAFSGTQLVALAAEIPPPAQFGLPEGPASGLVDFINKYYGQADLSLYVEGSDGIDKDIDTSFGSTNNDDKLVNTCWDLTPYLYWTSNKPAIADVSNTPGQIGRILRKGGASGGVVTFTGTRLELNRAGQIGNPVTVTCEYDFAATPEATVTSLFLTPRVQRVFVNSPQPQAQLFAVAGYSDGTNQTINGNGVTWTTSDPAVEVALDGSVSVTGTPANSIVTITAQHGSVTSKVELTVLSQ